MDETKGKFQYSGLKFLYENELVDDPQLINNLKLNVFAISRHVRDVEFLSSYHHKQMLVWIDLDWMGRTFLKNRIVIGVTDRIQELLPKFKLRVVTDRKILELALDRVKNVLNGGKKDEQTRNAADGGTVPDPKPSES